MVSKDDFGKAINPAIKKFLRDTQTIVALEIFATGLEFNWIEAEPLLTNIEILNEHHRFDTTGN